MCEHCKDTGVAMIDVGAPGGNGCIEGYCDCEHGSKLAKSEICARCGEHKYETPERKVYTAYGTDHRYCYYCMSHFFKSQAGRMTSKEWSNEKRT